MLVFQVVFEIMLYLYTCMDTCYGHTSGIPGYGGGEQEGETVTCVSLSSSSVKSGWYGFAENAAEHQLIASKR